MKIRSNLMEEMRATGHKIRVTHFRYLKFDDLYDAPPLDVDVPQLVASRQIRETNAKLRSEGKVLREVEPNGGKVVVEIVAPDGVTVKGESVCCVLDNFRGPIGTQMAFGRAVVELLDLPRKERLRKASGPH